MVRESLSFSAWKTGTFLCLICITGFWAAAATGAMLAAATGAKVAAPPEVPGIGLGMLVEVGLDMMNALVHSGSGGETALEFLRLLFRE